MTFLKIFYVKTNRVLEEEENEKMGVRLSEKKKKKKEKKGGK